MNSLLSSLPLYNREQVRAAEELAVKTERICNNTLVERAATAAVELLISLEKTSKPILVLAGFGKNGADAYQCANLLLAKGHQVDLMALDKIKPSDVVMQCRNDYLAQGGKITPFDKTKIHQAKVIIDGLFGIGLNRPLNRDIGEIISAINDSDAWVLSLDIPSGINANTGCQESMAVEADCTITFCGHKLGLYTARARHCTGTVYYAEIGVSQYLSQTSAYRVSEDYLTDFFTPRARDSHKGQMGAVAIIGGDLGMSGAVQLAGESCLRAGAGLVCLCSHNVHQAGVNGRCPELMFCGCDTINEEFDARIERAKVLVLGPGLGQKKWGETLFHHINGMDKPSVLDADALNLLSQFPKKRSNWVLTPHSGEAARLLNTSVEQIEQNRFSSVKALQGQYGGVIVLKGAGSLIFDGTNLFVAAVGNPGLSSGGSGDVLSGIIAALLAQGINLTQAAVAGVIVHGSAADLAARSGERGMIASDLLPFIRQMVNMYSTD